MTAATGHRTGMRQSDSPQQRRAEILVPNLTSEAATGHQKDAAEMTAGGVSRNLFRLCALVSR